MINRRTARRLRTESLESRCMLSATSGGFAPVDVNRDGSVSPADAVMVINELNDPTQSVSIPAELNVFDVNEDGVTTALDALTVINELNPREDSTSQRVEAMSSFAVLPDSEVWILKNQQYNNLLADVGNGDAGLRIDGLNTQWSVTTTDSGTTLRSLQSGEYLAAANWEVFTIAQPTATAYWTIVNHADGTISLQNNLTQRYLDGDVNQDVGESQDILLDDRWSVTRELASTTNEIWRLSNREYVGRDLYAADSGADHQSIRTAISGSAGTEWEVLAGNDGTTFRNVSTGQFLGASTGVDWEVVKTADQSDYTLWNIVDNPDGSISLQNVATGRYMDADGVGENWNVDESLAIRNDDGWFVSVVNSTAADPVESVVWSLANRQYRQHSLHAAKSGNADLAVKDSAPATSIQWAVATDDRGTSFRNVGSGEYLASANWQASLTADAGSNIYWDIVTNDDQSISLQNRQSGRYLDGDGAFNSWNVDESLAILNDDGWFVTVVEPPVFTEVRFGMIGDYGTASDDAIQVAALVGGADVDFVVGIGDARYGGETYDDGNGSYCEFLSGVTPGPSCPSGGDSEVNRFFTAPGNHDYTDGGGIAEFTDYFDFPGNGVLQPNPSHSERYFDFVNGPVHFFVLDSQAMRATDFEHQTQVDWLQSGLATSQAAWQIVVVHHAPYSSSLHGPHPSTQLPYADWGVDLVLAGHDHTYERIERDGTTFIVNGLGGRSRYPINDLIAGSQVAYRDNHGAAFFDATTTSLTGSFVNIDGEIIDSFSVQPAG